MNHTICLDCKGRGKKSQRIRKKVKLRYHNALAQFKKNNGEGSAPEKPKAHLEICKTCGGSGLISSVNNTTPDTENYPTVAIIGGGIGGVALAVACLHRGIPFTLYERDGSFDERSQGYGLTLQQASKAIAGFGITNLEKGVVSTRHVVHTTDGNVIGEWGMRKWLEEHNKTAAKRSNVHIARQSLRMALLEQLGGNDAVQWNHQFIDFKKNADESLSLNFEVDGKIKTNTADLIVGADGIRSAVRKLVLCETQSPLRYLDCMVILGICPLAALNAIQSELLDSATVFQTANGEERIYMMPYDPDTIMWQLSFPISEEKAKDLSFQGAKVLKEEACKRTQWHDPIPQIMAATHEKQISGYPVYDRELLNSKLLQKAGPVTLLGDAAHPMSPFKGQGANQALLDALALARAIYKNCAPRSQWKEIGLRKAVLATFESEMLTRSASKVKDSAAAAQFLHSEIALEKTDAPRGGNMKNK